MLVPISLGNPINENALALADFLVPFGVDVLRATIDQNLCLRNIPEAFLGEVFGLVQGITKLAAEPRFQGSSVACTGASTCELGICLSRGALAAVVQQLRAANLDLDLIEFDLKRLNEIKQGLSGLGGDQRAEVLYQMRRSMGKWAILSVFPAKAPAKAPPEAPRLSQ